MSYIDVVEDSDTLVVWERNVDGVIETKRFPSEDYLYCYIPQNGAGNSEFTDIYKKPVKKVSFDSKFDMREFASTRETLESDVPLKYRLLIDEYYGKPVNKFNTLFYDIEVAFDLTDGHGFPTPKNPFGEVNLIQTFDNVAGKYIIFGYHVLQNFVTLTDPSHPVEIRWVDNEREMLSEFASYLDEGEIDYLAGWFVAGFDLPYIMERAIVHFGKKKARSMFCRDGYLATKKEFTDTYGEDVWEWQLAGRKNVDMMELYKKFIPSEQTSFKLDAIAEKELGENKVEVDDGDLGELYRGNPQKFYEYGKRDVELLKRLDDKLQLMNLANMLAVTSCALISDVTGSVKPIENGFMGFCRERKIVLPDKKDNDKEQFEGALVYNTIPGRHGWVMTADLTALYPSVMIMLGLSTETLIAQCRGEFDDYIAVMSGEDKAITVEYSDGWVEMVLAGDLREVILREGYTISANGTIFSGELGLLSEYVQTVFLNRKKFQKMSKEALTLGDKLMGGIYDLMQKVLKIRANSLYGCISNNYFRLFDIRMAKSITLTGQIISKWQAYKGNAYIEELAGDV